LPEGRVYLYSVYAKKKDLNIGFIVVTHDTSALVRSEMLQLFQNYLILEGTLFDIGYDTPQQFSTNRAKNINDRIVVITT
jgi:hypothetical protein